MSAAAQVRAVSAGSSGAAVLSEREAQIADLIVTEGLTSWEIAARLGISPLAVTAHLRRIFPKIGVRSRAELFARLRDPAVGSVAPAAAEIARLTARIREGQYGAICGESVLPGSLTTPAERYCQDCLTRYRGRRR